MVTRPKPNPLLNPTRPKPNPALAASRATKEAQAEKAPKKTMVPGAGAAKYEQMKSVKKNPFSQGVGSIEEKLKAPTDNAVAEKLARTARQTRKGK